MTDANRPATRDAVLTTAEMYDVDRRTIAGGATGPVLMERAGRAVAEAARRLASEAAAGRVLVLCGPGSNGGDGFVAARLLKDAGLDVTLALLGERGALQGDARVMAELWTGGVRAFDAALATDAGVVVDAVFGAGLSRDVGGRAREMLEAVDRATAPVLAVDVPSGLDGDSGGVRGFAPQASRTVTFVRPKPGHLLPPGRALCGRLDVADIGAPDAVVAAVRPLVRRNRPAGFAQALTRPAGETHKYERGHVAVFSGPRHRTGAARLTAGAAVRAGAGAATLLGPADALDELAARETAIMVREAADGDAAAAFLQESRVRAAAVGPGNGVGSRTIEIARAVLGTGVAAVLDADALTAFSNDPDRLFRATAGARAVLTPHRGEFARLFPDLPIDRSGALAAARDAARRAGCVVVLKGWSSVIAAPDGRAAINDNAPADLATAGSGDVLAGLIAGTLAAAPGAGAFEAACAGVWVHGECGTRAGFGLVAEDLAPHAPAAFLAALREARPDLDAGGLLR